MWFLFKKRKEDKRWDTLQENLKNSFSYIQKDMAKLRQKDQSHDDKLQEMQGYIMKLNSAIDALIEKEQIDEENMDQEMPELMKISSSIKGKIWSNLTNVQKKVLITLSLLQEEERVGWISMKYLAEELYPDKEYNAVKSMLSTYTDNLLEWGLMDKKRKGRGTFLTLTPKALKLLPKTTKKKLKPLIKT